LEYYELFNACRWGDGLVLVSYKMFLLVYSEIFEVERVSESAGIKMNPRANQ
jgi:hypothetical protein